MPILIPPRLAFWVFFGTVVLVLELPLLWFFGRAWGLL